MEDSLLCLEVNLTVNVGGIGEGSCIINLGNLVVAVNKHCKHLSDIFRYFLLVYGELGLHQDVVSILLHLGVYLAVKFCGGSSLLGRIGECAEAIKPCFLNELTKLGEVLVGFTGETNHCGCTEDDSGHLIAKPFHRLFNEGGAAVAIHSCEDAIGDMLDWNVHIFEKTIVITKLGNKLVGNLVGIAIKKSDPRNGGVLRDLSHKLGEGVFAVKVKTVSCGILRDEVNLLYAHCLKILCFGNDVLDCSGAESAADEGDCAVGATVVAALCNFEISGVWLGSDNTIAAKLALLLITEGGVLFAAHYRLAGVRNIAKTSYANKGIYLRHLIHHFVTIALNKAACCYDMFTFSPLFEGFCIKNAFDGFLLCALYKAAGVDNNDLCLLLVWGDFKSP